MYMWYCTILNISYVTIFKMCSLIISLIIYCQQMDHHQQEQVRPCQQENCCDYITVNCDDQKTRRNEWQLNQWHCKTMKQFQSKAGQYEQVHAKNDDTASYKSSNNNWRELKWYNETKKGSANEETQQFVCFVTWIRIWAVR